MEVSLEDVESRLGFMREELSKLGSGVEIRFTKGEPAVLTVLCDPEALLAHFRNRFARMIVSDAIPAPLLRESLSHFAALFFMHNLGRTCTELMDDLEMAAVLMTTPEGTRGKNLDAEKNRVKKLIKERSKVRAKHLAGIAKPGPLKGATWQQTNTKRISGLRSQIDDAIRTLTTEGEGASRRLVAERLRLPNTKSLDRQRKRDGDLRPWRQVVRDAMS